MASTIAKLVAEMQELQDAHEEEKKWLKERIHLLRADLSRLHDLYFDKVKQIETDVALMREYLTSNKDFKRWAMKELFD